MRCRLLGMSETTGFIGLGHMGRPMARHLAAAGRRMLVHNRSRGVVDELVAEGMQAAGSAAEVARGVGDGVVFLCVTNHEAAEAVAGELIPALAAGALVVDMGSDPVDRTRAWCEAARGRGADWLDAPVSGGEKGAVAASLTIFCGGSKAAFGRARPLLELLGSKATHLGGPGAGQVAKLANQLIVASQIASLSEAFLLARRAGVELGALREALGGGFADSTILQQHGLRMVEEDYQPGGAAVNQLKDVREGMRVAAGMGLRLPVLEANDGLWRAMIDAGLGELDHSGMFRFYERHLNPEKTA